MQWFDHSSTAASDDAIIALRMEYPDSAAVDCYWCIIEKQFNDERPVPFSETDRETKALAHRLCVGFESLTKYVNTMLEIGLLKQDENGHLYSERANEAIAKYQRRCETARENGKKGGRKPNKKPNAKPTRKPTEKPTRSNRKENNTSIGFDKQNLYCNETNGADAQGAPSVSQCPTCDANLTRTGSHKPNGETLYRCDLCGTEVWL